MGNELGSSVSVPVSKSLAISSYDALSKTYTMKKEIDYIDYESLPIKNFEKYSIGCLKDGSGGSIMAGLGIATLNLAGLFTGTNIDYPDHWFLIAKATNWINDIDEMISLSREIIKNKEENNNFVKALELLPEIKGCSNIGEVTVKLFKFIDERGRKIINLLEEYNKIYTHYSCKIDKNGLDIYCIPELQKIYFLLKNNENTKKISEYLDNFEKILEKMEKKIYYLIEKGSTCKGITKYDNIDDIFRNEKNNYHDNKIEHLSSHTLKRKITIKDIDDYVKTLSDSYNLIDDNCQTFVRNILNHFT